MTNQKSSIKNIDARPNQEKSAAIGLRVRTALKAGRVTFQDLHFTK